MPIKRKTGEKLFNCFNIIFLSLLSLICIYPMLYVLFASISDPHRLTTHQGILLAPLGFTLKGYSLVLKNPNIKTGYINTIIYVLLGTFISLLLTTLGAYALSRKRVYFAKHVMILILITMFFQGGLIPFYLLMKDMHMINTIWAIVLPSAISSYNLIVMRTSFAEIPDSFEESAKIDGANDFTILVKIIIPVSKAIMAVMLLFYAVGMWNSWFNASILLRDRNLYPLQLVLREILISGDKSSMVQVSEIGAYGESAYRSLVQYSTIIIATVPILCVYPFLQKYFVKGVMIGSIKG